MTIPEWKPSAALFNFVNSRPYVHDEKTALDYWMHKELRFYYWESLKYLFLTIFCKENP